MFSVALLLLLAAGSCVKCEQLTQPTSLNVQPGQTLTISCQVSYSVTSYGTHWVRQPAGKALQWMGVIWGDGDNNYASSLQARTEITRDTSKNIVYLRLSTMKPDDSAVYYCAGERGVWAFDYWGDGTTVTVLPDGEDVTPSLFALSPQQDPSHPLKTADELSPDVCLAAGFRPKGGDVIINGKGGPVNVSTDDAVLSNKNTYYSVAFSNETIYSCGMNGTFSNNEADDACGRIYPEKAKLNFYMLMMNGVRVVYTKALAFSTVLTIRGLLF